MADLDVTVRLTDGTDARLVVDAAQRCIVLTAHGLTSLIAGPIAATIPVGLAATLAHLLMGNEEQRDV